jgi:hypothetical protein
LLAHELTHTLQQGCAVRERVARQTDTGKPVESVPSEADATPLVDTMQQHRSSGTTLQRASKKANESKARIDRMVDDPAFAHKVWHKTSAEGKDLVLERMRKRYGPDWLDEFLTLQEGGFRGKGFENEVYVPTSVPGAPSVDELLYRGFVRVYKHRTLPDETFEIWVRPSGKQIRITRQEEAGRGATTEPQGQESTPPERETEEEANEDFSREELEELFGITIPEDFHFVRAELVSEEEGRRTIKIFYQGLFGVENLPQIMCAADDTCYVNLPLSGRNKVTQELFNVSE